LAVTLSGPLAGIALLLVMIGVFSVMRIRCRCRRKSFGVRMAVGAQPRQILAMVLRGGAALIAGGIGVGCFASFALTAVFSQPDLGRVGKGSLDVCRPCWR